MYILYKYTAYNINYMCVRVYIHAYIHTYIRALRALSMCAHYLVLPRPGSVHVCSFPGTLMTRSTEVTSRHWIRTYRQAEKIQCSFHTLISRTHCDQCWVVLLLGFLYKKKYSRQWWRTPLILALRRQRQVDLSEFEASPTNAGSS